MPVFKNIDFPKTVPALIQNVPGHPADEELDLRELTEDEIEFEQAVKGIPSGPIHVQNSR